MVQKTEKFVKKQTSWNTISQDLDKGLATGIRCMTLLAQWCILERVKKSYYGFTGNRTINIPLILVMYWNLNLEHGWKLGQKWNAAHALSARHYLKMVLTEKENLIGARQVMYPNNQGSGN